MEKEDRVSVLGKAFKHDSFEKELRNWMLTKNFRLSFRFYGIKIFFEGM